jgi:hypothetical protein
MTTHHRTPSRASSHKKARRRGNADECRYQNAWDDTVGYGVETAEPSAWQRLRRLSSSRTGRVIMLAPVGALGAYLFLRRRR